MGCFDQGNSAENNNSMSKTSSKNQVKNPLYGY